MSIYSDKLAHVQVVINCRDSIAQICTHEDTLLHNLGSPYLDDVMSIARSQQIGGNSLKLGVQVEIFCVRFLRDYSCGWIRRAVRCDQLLGRGLGSQVSIESSRSPTQAKETWVRIQCDHLFVGKPLIPLPNPCR